MAKQDAQWVTIDPTTLDADVLEAYAQYKDAYREMKELRNAFEKAMAVDVPSGERMIFGYNFGKLSIAIVADDRVERKPKQATQSLADYLARRAAAGQSC